MNIQKNSNWIWTPEWNGQLEARPTAVLFRKKIRLGGDPVRAVIRISAESRYKLYINGIFAESGPSKGDAQVWYMDEVDITPCLKRGNNILAVAVLHFPTKPSEGNQSVMSTTCPGLYLTGSCKDTSGKEQDISAGEDYLCAVDTQTEFVAEAQGFAPLHIYERVHSDRRLYDYKETDYDDNWWTPALAYTRRQIRQAVSPGNLLPRTIPYMRRQKRRFESVVCVRRSSLDDRAWRRMTAGTEKLAIPAFSEEIVEISAGEEMTGYLRLAMSGGAGSSVELLQSEAYVQDTGDGKTVKKDRADWVNGHLEGYSDLYYPAGTGSADHPEVYEPFWFRTFRFIQLRIKTGASPLCLHDFTYEETGYPLDIRSGVETSDDSLRDIWDISARTLKRCMHETYMDCPFYEQLQYVMDSRAQILYTYALSADDRLARKCMDDFRRSLRYDGTMCSAYPNQRPNVIPGFSIYYILMLHDHMMYFGDAALIRSHLPAVERVLDYFRDHLTEQGYVGKTGSFHGQGGYWSFIDWPDEFISGVPKAAEKGPITMESLLYILGLDRAAQLCRFIGRGELASEYISQAHSVREAVRMYCTGQSGMIQDGPGYEGYSQHCQVFAVLTDTVGQAAGRQNLLRTLNEPENFPQCSVAMSLYLFRALEITGLYEYTEKCWNIWRQMIENNMTTCAESNTDPRSECHAWGALALYELPAAVLGVRPAAPGFEKVRIRPVPGYLNWARGTAATPKGEIRVEWKKTEDGIDLKYQLPDGMVAAETI